MGASSERRFIAKSGLREFWGGQEWEVILESQPKMKQTN
jgi:hypothetical protein